MAHIMGKWSKKGKETEKCHEICVIAKGKMSLSQVAVSLYTSKIEIIKCKGKSIVRCSNKVSKSHHHVYESRTFSKGLTWCKLTITPIYETLTKSENHLVFGHSPQTLTIGVVRMLYLRNMKHIYNKLQCDYNARISNASRKERY